MGLRRERKPEALPAARIEHSCGGGWRGGWYLMLTSQMSKICANEQMSIMSKCANLNEPFASAMQAKRECREKRGGWQVAGQPRTNR